MLALRSEWDSGVASGQYWRGGAGYGRVDPFQGQLGGDAPLRGSLAAPREGPRRLDYRAVVYTPGVGGPKQGGITYTPPAGWVRKSDLYVSQRSAPGSSRLARDTAGAGTASARAMSAAATPSGGSVTPSHGGDPTRAAGGGSTAPSTGNRPASETSTPAQATDSTGNPYSTPASGASPPSSQENIDKWRPILENNGKGPLMQGNDVKELQHALNQLMGWGIAEDSKFGDETEWAVRQFQRRMGIGVDGIVGAETRAALKKALASGGLPPPNTMYETPTPGAPGTPEVASGSSGKLKIEYAQGVPALEGCDPRLKPVVEELGKRFGASKVIVTETKRTREEHERIYRDRPPRQKVEYATCQHGSVQGYKAADITFFRPDGSRIPPSEVAKVAAEIREVGGIGTYSGLTCTHIDLRQKGPDGKPVVWHWDN